MMTGSASSDYASSNSGKSVRDGLRLDTRPRLILAFQPWDPN